MAKPITTLPHDVALKGRDPMTRVVTPDAPTLEAMKSRLDLSALRKVTADLTFAPIGAKDWELSGRLGATVVQPCVVTLDPVTTRIETDVARRYLADYVEPEASEVESPEDDTAGPLPASVELGEILEEALALALPDFPRKDGVELGEAVYAAPGVTPMRDEDAKLFAGLAALKSKLAGDTDG